MADEEHTDDEELHNSDEKLHHSEKKAQQNASDPLTLITDMRRKSKLPPPGLSKIIEEINLVSSVTRRQVLRDLTCVPPQLASSVDPSKQLSFTKEDLELRGVP
ncbi:MAG: hypothetical protein ACXV2E_03725 [Halobacteriota archaeon]